VDTVPVECGFLGRIDFPFVLPLCPEINFAVVETIEVFMEAILQAPTTNSCVSSERETSADRRTMASKLQFSPWYIVEATTMAMLGASVVSQLTASDIDTAWPFFLILEVEVLGPSACQSFHILAPFGILV